MLCYGKKGEAINMNAKKDSQMKKLSKNYVEEKGVENLSEKELNILNTVMRAGGKTYSVKGCKGLNKSKNKFIASSVRIIEKGNNNKYGIVLTSSEEISKKMEVDAKELSTILEKYFDVKCVTKCRREYEVNER